MKTKTPESPAPSPAQSPTPSEPDNSIPCQCSRCAHSWTATARRPKHCPACGESQWWRAAAPESTKLPTVYYDGGVKGGAWLLQVGANRFINASDSTVKLHLKHAGAETMPGIGNLTRIEHELHQAQLHRVIDFAGTLGGWNVGHHTLRSGINIIVTSGPRAVIAKRGQWPGIKRFLSELLEPGDQQYGVVLAWLALARQSLARGDFRAAQALALGGPQGSGKTFFSVLFKQLLGSRVGLPFDYMTGKSNFNEDLIQSECWVLDDKASSTRFEQRRQLGQHLKEFTVGDEIRCAPKGRRAMSFQTFRRILMLFNSEAENAAILPPMDGSMSGKIILCLCGEAKLSEDKLRNQKMLDAELPAFAAYLDAFKVPEMLKARELCECSLCAHEESAADVRRFGFRTYHHPELVEILTSLSPEQQLWSVIQQASKEEGFPLRAGVFEGTAEALELAIFKTPMAAALATTKTFPGSTGTYLGRIATKKDGRITKATREGTNIWSVKL